MIEISFTYTRLSTVDNKVVFIPNSKVASSDIINFSAEELRRLDIIFSIGYSDDSKLAKKLILDVIERSELALNIPEPLVRVCGYGENSVNIACYTWVKGPDYLPLSYDIYEQVKDAFDKNGITIPLKQLDINIKK